MELGAEPAQARRGGTPGGRRRDRRQAALAAEQARCPHPHGRRSHVARPGPAGQPQVWVRCDVCAANLLGAGTVLTERAAAAVGVDPTAVPVATEGPPAPGAPRHLHLVEPPGAAGPSAAEGSGRP